MCVLERLRGFFQVQDSDSLPASLRVPSINRIFCTMSLFGICKRVSFMVKSALSGKH